MKQEYTAEQQADIDKRSEEFKKEYRLLVEKYQMDYGSYPAFDNSPQGYVIKTPMVIYDLKYLPQVPKEGVVSPIQPGNV